MASTVLVRVVGFSDVERHSLNTLFRLSDREGMSYALWTPESAGPAQVALIDVDSYEAGMELVSPSLNPHLKMICVGAEAPTMAWRRVPRPVDWTAMLALLDELFVPITPVPADPIEAQAVPLPLGVKCALLAGLPLEARLYLRARLSLAGIYWVDEAPSVAALDAYLYDRRYDVVLAYVDTQAIDPWLLVKHLQDLETPVASVIAVSTNASWKASNLAESMGCVGLLEVPFNPLQVIGLLQRV